MVKLFKFSYKKFLLKMKYKNCKKNIKEDKNKIYTVLVYNKPKGEIVSKKDPQEEKTIYDSLEKNINIF